MQLQRTLNSLLVISILLFSCSKRITDLQTLEHNVKAAAHADSSSYSRIKKTVQQQTFTISSGENDYLVNIVPDGDFHFDMNTGFTGKAKSISIKGKQKTKMESGSTSGSTVDSLHKKESQTSSEQQEHTSIKNKKTASEGLAWPLKWIIITVLTAAAFLIAYKPLKKAITWLRSYSK